MNSTYLRGIYLRLAGVLVAVVTLALVANALLSHRMFERALAPQLAAKVASVGASVRALAFKWVEQGVELEELYGVEQRFKEAMVEGPEISYMAITNPKGQVLFESARTPAGAAEHFHSTRVLALEQTAVSTSVPVRVGDLYFVSMPMKLPERALGTLHVGVDVRFVDGIVLEMLYDMGVVLVVTLFFTLELLNFIAGSKLDASLRALGDTLERGAAGNFATRGRRATEPPFDALQRHLDAVLERINKAYEALACRVELAATLQASRPAEAVAAAGAGARSLSKRFRFGRVDDDARGDDRHVTRVRAPLFMFILAEELTRSFVPGYVKDLLVPVAGLSPQMVVGLPIALFMLIVAVAQPFLGIWCQRVGIRRSMLIGAAIAAIGFLATALAHNVLDLLLWRSLCALGYAMVFVAAQTHVLDSTGTDNRARSFAVFVGAIMAASVCGPSIGGILADNIGARATFGAAAALAACSIFVIRTLPEGGGLPTPAGREAARLPRWSDIATLLGNGRFLSVTLLAAVPAKVLLTGICFYLVPLYVLSIGSTQAVAGRLLMTYGVVMVVLGPWAAGLATTRARMVWLVAGGLVVSGLGGLAMLAGGGVGWLFVAMLLIGLGQSMSIAAQSALVSEHCNAMIEQVGAGVVYGVYRLLERTGNALGPLVAAALAMQFGNRSGFIGLGAAVVVCGLVFLLTTRRQPQPALAAA